MRIVLQASSQTQRWQWTMRWFVTCIDNERTLVLMHKSDFTLYFTLCMYFFFSSLFALIIQLHGITCSAFPSSHFIIFSFTLHIIQAFSFLLSTIFTSLCILFFRSFTFLYFLLLLLNDYIDFYPRFYFWSHNLHDSGSIH